MLKKQKGFGSIELLIILAVLGIILVAGWFFWRAQSRVDKEVSPKTSLDMSQKNTSKSSETNNSSAPESEPTGGYEAKPLVADFSIKEWAVTFKIAQDLNKLTYAIVDENSIGFAYSGWETIDSNCSPARGAAGYLARYEEKSASAEIKEVADKHQGNYYYVYDGPQAPCSQNEQIMNEQTSTQPAINLRNSIRTSLQ